MDAKTVVSTIDPPNDMNWKEHITLIVPKRGKNSTKMISGIKDTFMPYEAPGDLKRVGNAISVIGGSSLFNISSAVDVSILQNIINSKNDLVVGITAMHSSYAIVLYSVEENCIVDMLEQCQDRVSPEVLVSAINLAIEIGCGGREGKPVGTAFIIGDSEAVLQKSHQLILNPLEGHPTEVRLITKMENWETIKELAQLDGAFVVDKEGVVLSAGRYIDMKMKSVGTLPKGFGTRHNAATAITKKTKAIAVILSKSGGEVRVFKDGEVIYRTPPLQMISYKSKKEPA
ncbi:MAG: DNA integrity scanning protein DisA nucleotide-binding domain protein [Methermicoccaceae archaeon]